MVAAPAYLKNLIMISSNEQVPDDVMECVVIVQKHLFQAVSLKDPTICAYAFQYFIKTYRSCPNRAIFVIIRAVATLHLASKVCEEAKLLNRFVFALEDCKMKENLVIYFQRLGIYQQLLEMNSQKMIELAKNAELDVIQDLEFDFFIELPYDYIRDYINTVIHWHLTPDNINYFRISEETYKTALTFLNDLQMSFVFYKYQPKVIAQTALRLSFHLCHITLPDLRGTRWYSILVPEYPVEILDHCTELSFNYFVKRGLDFATRKPSLFPQNVLMEWICPPILNVSKLEPKCPPPPVELLKKCAIDPDNFPNLWSDHIPTLPPPNVLDLEHSYRHFFEPETKTVYNYDHSSKMSSHKRITFCSTEADVMQKNPPKFFIGCHEDLLRQDNTSYSNQRNTNSSELSTPTEIPDYFVPHR